jgi:hypothetical protein
VMKKGRPESTLILVAGFAVAKLIFHTIINQHYGFHRDELATLDDARHLAFAYVAHSAANIDIGPVGLFVIDAQRIRHATRDIQAPANCKTRLTRHSRRRASLSQLRRGSVLITNDTLENESPSGTSPAGQIRKLTVAFD